MKRSIFLAAGLCGLLNAGMLPSNVINSSSLAQENGGAKVAIDAYSDGAGALLINQAADSKFDNSPMNKLVFKFGEDAKKNSLNLVQEIQTVSTISNTQEKLLAGSILAVVPPSCLDVAMSWNGVTKLCEKGGVSTYAGTSNNSYSCPSGGTLSGTTCLNSTTYTASQSIAGYTLSGNSDTLFIGMGLFKNGNTFNFCWSGTCGANVFLKTDGSLSGNTLQANASGFVTVPGGFYFKNGTTTYQTITRSGTSISGNSGVDTQGIKKRDANSFYMQNIGYVGANIQWVPFYSGYDCPSGGNLSGTTCTIPQNYGATNTPYYTCPTGGTLSGSTCTQNTSTTAPGICPAGYTINSFQCNKN